ncbi:hypothetical protein [Azospirillum melinis]
MAAIRLPESAWFLLIERSIKKERVAIPFLELVVFKQT